MLARIAGALAVTFAQPGWLATLPAAMLPILLAALGRKRERRIPPAAVAAQCLALVAVAFALARPQAALTGRAALPYLLFIDRSGSTRGQLPPAGTLEFPAGAEVERFDFAEALRRSTGAPVAEEPSAEFQAATNVAPVLRTIAARRPSGMAAAIMVTDGHFTDDDWTGPAEAVAQGGAEILIVPLDSPPPDARIVDLTARRAGPDAVEVAVAVSSNAPLERTLTVSRVGRREPLLVKPLTLLGDTPATIRLSDALAPDAAGEYTARLDARDRIAENDSAAALVLPVRQKLAAIGADGKTPALLRSLSLPVSALAPGDLPASPAGLAEFSAVFIADATGALLGPAQRRALAEYVRSGGGLILIGTGPHERPADEDDPLNRVLPLRANPFQRSPLALTVLLDRSGSMGRTTTAPGRAEQIKFELAAEATLALREHLTPRDTLAVITFADRGRTIYDSGGGPADFAALRDRLGKVRPTGSTEVLPAIQAALSRPAGATGTEPMLLVLSDLKTESFDASAWAGKISDAGARLAVVAIGEAAPGPTPLERLASLLGRRASYQRREDLIGLAKVFASLVRRGRGDAIRRQKTALLVEAPLFETEMTALPEMEAYILAGKHPDAELLARTAGGDPVLARRRAGLGRSVALALPMSGSDNASWQDSPDVAKLLAAAARWALRGANDTRFDVQLTRRAGELHVTAHARQNGAPLNGLQLSAAIVADGIDRSVEFRQTAPGGYAAAAACPPQAPAAVAIRDEGGATVWRGSAAALCPPEYRQLGADREGLQRLARTTGGRIVTLAELPGALQASYSRRFTELWPWLLGAAAALMLVEWSFARITRR